jgi:hypothetical protein
MTAEVRFDLSLSPEALGLRVQALVLSNRDVVWELRREGDELVFQPKSKVSFSGVRGDITSSD